MPTPPKLGVTRSCQRSPVGSATSRSPSDERRSVQMTRAATGKAAIVTAALTSGKGRRGL